MRIIYSLPGSSHIYVVTGAAKSVVEAVLGPLTDQEYKDHIWERSVPADAVNPIEIDDSVDLSDRYFRNAWKGIESNAPLVSFKKAREIQKNKLRTLRTPLLDSLDIDYFKALETNDTATQAEIVQKKNTLRDITTLCDDTNIADLEELKTVGMDVLDSI